MIIEFIVNSQFWLFLFKNVSFYSEFARRLDSTSLFLLPGNAGFGAYASFTYAITNQTVV